MPHPASFDDERLLKECQISRVRRSGPGGQHRNKVETGIVIEHLPTHTIAEANERRNQAENRKVAIFRLRLSLAVEVRSKGSDPPILSELWQSRVAGGKISVNARHADYPSLLAETLDVFDHFQFDLKSTANLLTVSPSQLVKFMKQEPRAFLLVNSRRKQRGLHILK